MDFTTMGTVNSYIKGLTLQKKWQMKKETGNFKINAEKAQVQDWFEQERKNHADKELEMIRSKLEKGKKLTPAEMSYLEKEDPETYKKAKAIEAEKKNFEEELKRCKTKDDVERAKFARAAASLSRINSVKNDPNIPESAKLAVAIEENMKASARDKIMEKFVASGRYHELPTDAEKRAAEKALKEAEEAQKAETTKPTETKEDPSDTEKADKAEKTSDTAVQNRSETHNAKDEKPTISETNQRNDVKKLKNSKKRYIECSEKTMPNIVHLPQQNAAPEQPSFQMDIKA